MDITEFLKARITEDEAAARAVPPLGYNHDMGGNKQEEQFTFDRWLPNAIDGMGNSSKHRHNPATETHFSRWTPQRVLAECAAKRVIIELHHPFNHHGEHGDYAFCAACQWDHGSDEPRTDMDIAEYGHPCQTLRALATIYADHPDFQEAWRA